MNPPPVAPSSTPPPKRPFYSPLFLAFILAIVASVASCYACKAPQAEKKITTSVQNKDSIVLGAGCFWCVETLFASLEGVDTVVSGYSNGTLKNPTYKEVCSGLTGHAEVVKVTFDPAIISLKEILEIFFTVHDPTMLNRQGNDIGTQYRSGIYFNSPEQEKTAKEVMADLTKQKVWDAPIVTEIVAAGAFYAAEDYHQNYYNLNGEQAYCKIVIEPKVVKFRQYFGEKLKK